MQGREAGRLARSRADWLRAADALLKCNACCDAPRSGGLHALNLGGAAPLVTLGIIPTHATWKMATPSTAKACTWSMDQSSRWHSRDPAVAAHPNAFTNTHCLSRIDFSKSHAIKEPSRTAESSYESAGRWARVDQEPRAPPAGPANGALSLSSELPASRALSSRSLWGRVGGEGLGGGHPRNR